MMDVNCREKSWHRHIWENYHDLTRSHCKYISCEASHSWWTIHVETWNSSTSGTFGGAVGVPFIDTKITTTRWWFQLYLEFSPLHYMGKDPVWLAYSSNSLNKKQQLELDNKLLESAFFFFTKCHCLMAHPYSSDNETHPPPTISNSFLTPKKKTFHSSHQWCRHTQQSKGFVPITSTLMASNEFIPLKFNSSPLKKR